MYMMGIAYVLRESLSVKARQGVELPAVAFHLPPATVQKSICGVVLKKRCQHGKR